MLHTNKKNMLSLFGALSIATVFSFSAFAQKTQDRMVGEFNGINASSALSVYVSQGSANTLRVEADSAVLPYVKTEVKDGILKMSNHYPHKIFQTQKRNLVKIYITVVNLNKIELSGATHLETTTSVKTNKMDLDLSGASNISLMIEADNMDADITGASNAKISGTVQTIEIETSGASCFRAFDLESNTAKIMATGASKIEINAKSDLRAHASGASSVVYKGNPLQKNVSEGGASSVKGY